MTTIELTQFHHYLKLFFDEDFSDLPHYMADWWDRGALSGMTDDVGTLIAWKVGGLRRERPVTEMQQQGQSQTLGEKRVRASFNPNSNSKVDLIKQKTAELIDLVEEYKNEGPTGGEAARCAALAQTHYEDAAMWAVKLVTF